MFWSIFLESLALILAIIIVGQVIERLLSKKSGAN